MATPPPARCAGEQRLCARRYDDVTFLTTHNAYATEGEFEKPDQAVPIDRQLALGVRGFMLDVHLDPDTKALALCHSDCRGGSAPFGRTLTQFRTFLDRHPGEIVTLIIEDNTANPLIAGAIDTAGLRPYLHVQEHGKPWPTLGEMVAANHRLVVFTENNRDDARGPDGREQFPGFHIAYDHMWDTPYGKIPKRDDLEQCPLLRGDRRHALFLINHFVTGILIPRAMRKQANRAIPHRVQKCLKEVDRRPNFLAVDWVDRNYRQLRATVQRLNK